MRVLIVLTILAGSLAAQSVPQGFVVDVLGVGGFGQTGPSALTVLPDGRVLVTGKGGEITVVLPDGTGRGTVGVVPSVFSLGDTGVNGITHDPNFAANGYIYLLYAHADGFVKFARFELTGDLADSTSTNLVLGAELVVLDDIPMTQLQHRGGGMEFGVDGMVYLAIGDDRADCAAQDSTSLKGQVLRMDVSGLPAAGPVNRALLAPADNPFSASADLNERLVIATGLRNPFTADLDPVGGTLYIGEVGGNLVEEVNAYPMPMAGATFPALNYGWPWFEGSIAATPSCPGSPPVGTTAAVWEELHANNFFAMIVAGVYRNKTGASDFGAAYEGDLFFSDFVFGQLVRISFDAMTLTWSLAPPVAGQPDPTKWATGFSQVVGWDQGPDGALYAVRRAPQRLERIRPGTTPGGLAYPGTDEDLITTYSVAGSPSIQVDLGTDRPDVHGGDPVWVRHESPAGTWVGNGELLVLGSTRTTGSVLPQAFPGLWIDLATVFLINQPVAGLPTTMPPMGYGYAFIHPGPTIAGISLYLQVAVGSSSAANGIFASSHALEIRLL